MPTKKQTITKVAVPKKPVPKKVIAKPIKRPPKTTRSTSGTVTPKTTSKPKTPMLVNAVPLSTISPKNPEQLLYEPEISAEKVEASVSQPDGPKRGRGRPRKNPEAVTTVPTAEPAKSGAQPAARVETAVAPMAPQEQAAPQPKRQHRSGWGINRRLLVGLATLFVLAAGGWYWHTSHAQDPASANAALINEISKHVVLPQGETPAVTTVVDETKVNQEFLKNAKKGDKVLLYFQSSQAIVYRPSTGQVVNMGPLQTPQPRVFIRQGSTADNVGIVRSIVSRTNEFLVASTDQSVKKDYTKTIVVDLTGNRPDLAGHLAQLLHVNVGNLPAGEDPPDADLMVIVGSDYK